MDAASLLSIHPLLSDRVRLAIMAALAASSEPLDFVTLRQQLDLTQGNLSSHMRKLEQADLVQISKEFVGRKPKTTYSCTAKGRKVLEEYLAEIEKTLKNLGQSK